MVSQQPKQYRELEDAIDAIAGSYDADQPINNLESAALPNKRKTIEALRELEPVLFMGFYATRALNRDNLRHAVAEHLYRAHDLLVDQIERALTYQNWYGRCENCPEPGSGEDIVIGLFRQIPELRRVLNTDLKAAFEGDPAAESIEEIVFSYPSVTAITAYRLAHLIRKARVPMIPRIFTEYAHGKTGIDIHPGATIGESFFIDHGTGVVIGESAVIGQNVKLYQGVTLGALSVPRRGPWVKRHPTLEDDVTVYAGATILGGDTVIGKGSVIGGNVWLTESVPPGSKVFGRAKGPGEDRPSEPPEK
ncbi:MAG TPA: serine O-acetyltransferase EpsC [Polyangiaceae bacterium LLY-WYZ-15_(1-7)]|nr:serine acetyltransferase [Sandaracinus sp.]HJK89260.1 serine O-acetyltransferase EpsC [Polyangiaceae bacterium LLY-WYZ-15_(1-7)]MBJ70423.1 serine acetyltransferase [Sandaracinus sp.]HJL03039.1 serine O-acetyltransferase EpsC [Polyangiaceae bacterium LLY-WYZ-15_(1-7)]HJL10235.1 serine O-acetyltransferase EpsC [Polyangiaceae bacterium LLY-WYZ-15_(1-7)]